MEELQELIEREIKEVARLILERQLAEKLKEAGLSVDAATLSKASAHIMSGSQESFKFKGGEDVTIQMTNDDIEYVVKATEQFYNEHLARILDKVADDTANRVIKSLSRAWPKEFATSQAEIEAFKERLEHRWGKALGKLRLFLAIVTEWSHGAYERRSSASPNGLSHLEDVLFRLHVRACQVTNWSGMAGFFSVRNDEENTQ